MHSIQSAFHHIYQLLLYPIILAAAAQTLSISNPDSLTLTHPLHTNIYHPQCHALTSPGIPGLNPTNCRGAANLLCGNLAGISPSLIPRDQWVWVDLVGCSVAHYIQEDVRFIPNMATCESGIFGEMREECAYNSSVNAGTVNVAVLPDYSQNGVAIKDGKPMYMMAPERQTF